MDERQRIEQAIAAQESLRATVGDEVVDGTILMLREKLTALEAPEQQRKLVTILYADIVGSTDIVKHLDPEDAMEIMDGALQRLALPVEEHGGHVARFMGDGLMALFGAPTAHENDPEMSIRAGLGILESAREIATELKPQWSVHDFRVRVGINTGLTVLGGMTEAEDTIMGSAVNLAKRIESAAPPGGLLISHDTYRHVLGVFNVEPREPIAAKGFDDPVRVYLVQGIKPRAFRLRSRGVVGIETRTVGRKAEVITLQEAYRNAVEGAQTQVITVVGEAGVGKSRLLYEFQNWLELHPDEVRFFQGSGRQETQFVPYALLKDVFTFRFRIHESDTTIEVHNKVESGFGEVFNPDDVQMRAHITGQLLGFDFSDSHAVKSILDDPQQIHERALMYLVEYFQEMSEQAPVIVFLEDIHWADDSSLDMLNRLVRKLPEQRLLIVCVARLRLYERRPHWGEGLATHRRLELQPLSNLDSSQLVSEILQKVDQIPDSLQDLVVRGAEGNPFYIEELIKMLIEDGVILTGEEEWQVESERLAEVDVPDTLTGVLQARLEGLPLEERTTLQQASVVGHIFWDDTIEYISAISALENTQSAVNATGSNLASLRSRELIYHREESTFTGAAEYTFKHAILRDVTYESVLKRVRKAYHGLVADWLISHSSERISEYTGLIADHLELAGKHEQAIAYLLQAGDQARRLYAHQEALDSYGRALALMKELGEHGRAGRTLMKMGLTYHNAFDFQAARQAYEQGLELWQQSSELRPSKTAPPAPHALRVAAFEPSNLDPALCGDRDSLIVACHLFSGLVEASPEMDILPDVARNWEVLEGGRKYVFHLRDDACWSDGVPVTTEDFVYAWKRVLNPVTGSQFADLLYDIVGARAFHQGQDQVSLGVQALDEFTLVVELEEPVGYFLTLLSYIIAFPVPRHVVQAHGTAWTEVGNIVTNGPFRLAAWERGRSMLLERDPAYHGRFTGNASRIAMSFTSKDSARLLQMYEQDRLDVLPGVCLLSAEIDRAQQKHAGDYVSSPGPSTLYIGFAADRPPFDDRRVRRAFTLATDRESLSDIAGKGYRFPATGGFVPPGIPGHSPGISLPYDPEVGSRLLAEAGYPGGRGFPTIDALVPNRPLALPIVAYLQAHWLRNLKVEVTWKQMEWGKFLDRLYREQPNMWLTGWVADYPDPDSFLRCSNWRVLSNWQDAAFDALVEDARRITNQEQRMGRYQQADKILVEEAPILPLEYNRDHLLVKPWVSRFPISAGRWWFWKDVIIESH